MLIFTFRLPPRYRRFLRFVFEGIAYQFTVLPFGLCLAKTKTSLPVTDVLPRHMLNTISESRAPSTRRLYAHKWRAFSSWCVSQSELETYRCFQWTTRVLNSGQVIAGSLLSLEKFMCLKCFRLHLKRRS